MGISPFIVVCRVGTMFDSTLRKNGPPCKRSTEPTFGIAVFEAIGWSARYGFRNDRDDAEEALELVQALGCSREDAHKLVDYVFDRPSGEPKQEVGGVMVTLAALCTTHGISLEEAADTECDRIWTVIDKIRAKQASKPHRADKPLPTD